MQYHCEFTNQPFTVSELERSICQQSGIPLPSLHPVERLIRLSAFRSRVSLHRRPCNATGHKILSAFEASVPHNVVDIDYWESEQWSGLDYGRDYDFSRSFFEQLNDLFETVPLPNLAVLKSLMQNSDFTNGITGAKNSYLLFSSSYNEDCLYSNLLVHCTNVLESAFLNTCELCFGCVNCQRSYNLVQSTHCSDCSDSAFLYNCFSCRDCFGCSNLSRGQYCFYNQQLTKAEYLQRRAAVDLGSYATFGRELNDFLNRNRFVPVKHIFGLNNENCSGGNFINNSKNCTNCYFCNKAEDLDWCIWLTDAKTSVAALAYGNGSELVYNSITVGDQSYDIKFCVECWPGAQHMEYCLYSGRGAAHLFGCVGIKKDSYCILNKHYSKSEYFSLRERIVAHMKKTGEYGQFFPTWMAPHAFNSSDGNAFFPLSEMEAKRRGFRWYEEDEVPASASTFIPPDHIRDVGDQVLSLELICEKTGKRFKIIKPELEVLRRQNLPLPRIAPMERIRSRAWIQTVLPTDLVTCSGCVAKIPSAFGSTQPVYCERCFADHVLT